MASTNSLTATLASSLFYIENRINKTLRRTFADSAAKAFVAAQTGSDEASLTVSRKLFPKGYDTELKAANAAKAAQAQHFNKHTIFADFKGGGGEGARGGQRRFIPAATVTAGEFDRENRALIDETARLGEVFAEALPNLIQRIGNDGVLGNAFDPSKYPSQDDVAAAFTLTPALETLEPVPEGIGIPATSESLKAAQTAYEARLQARYRYGMQRAAVDLTSSVANVAERLRELAEWQSTDPEKRQESLGRTKAPRITETLFPNVADAVARLRQFALPDSDEGSRLIQMLDDIEKGMAPTKLTPEHVKANGDLTKQVADNAANLASVLEELDFFD